MIQDFPLMLLGKIIQFVHVKEIYGNLMVVSKKLHEILNNPYIHKIIVSCYYSHPEIIKEANLGIIVKSLRNFKIEELPFWGMRTNAGVSGNSLRFWIGKAFMKSKSPQVGIKIHEQAFIEGGLAIVQVSFKNALVGFAKKIHEMFELDEDEFPLNIENIEIYKIYGVMYNFPNGFDFEDISYSILQEYGSQMSQMIYRLIHEDLMKLQDDLNPILPNYISEPRSIDIGRNTEFNQIVKTLMIYTSHIPFPDKFEINFKCQSLEQLEEYVKLQKGEYQISRLEKEQFGQFEQFEYCTFQVVQQQQQQQQQQQYQYQPLIWINFKHVNCDQISINFNKNEFRWCKYVHVRILDVDHKDEWEYEGVSLEYISLKGMLVDENSFEYVGMKNIKLIND